MSHFGILSFPGTGHLHPLTALGRELARRDHTVTVFQVADVEHLVRAAGLRFHQIGKVDFPLGALRVLDEKLGRLHGPEAMDFVFQRIHRNSQIILRDAPSAIRSERIDALVVDQAEPAGGSVADHLGLPFVRTGTGRMIPISELTADGLRTEIREILTNAQYRINANILQKQISAVNGVKRAADIIERVLDCRLSNCTLSFNALATARCNYPPPNK